MDIVESTRNTVDEQSRINARLKEMVAATRAFRDASANDEIIALPSGDGMALVFLRKLDAPLRCAIEIAGALRKDPFCSLRMGIHCGPVIIENDINERHNVSGDGINLAARVMSCGSDRHILLTRNAADLLRNLEAFAGKLYLLGEHDVKKDKIEVWTFVDGMVGNATKLTMEERSVSIRKMAWVLGAVGLFGAALYLELPRHQNITTSLSKVTLTAAETSIGLNLWRMRPSPPGATFRTRGLVLESDARGETDLTPELLTLSRSVSERDRIRISVQTFQPGFLYVVNRDLYHDGTKSAPTLLFPDMRIRGGRNLIQPGEAAGIPPMPQAFGVKRTRPDQIEILLTFILSPEPLRGIEAKDHEQILSEETVAAWESQWGTGVELAENNSMAGQLYTSADFNAERSSGAAAKVITPISLFRRKGHFGEPLVATARVKIGRS